MSKTFKFYLANPLVLNQSGKNIYSTVASNANEAANVIYDKLSKKFNNTVITNGFYFTLESKNDDSDSNDHTKYYNFCVKEKIINEKSNKKKTVTQYDIVPVADNKNDKKLKKHKKKITSNVKKTNKKLNGGKKSDDSSSSSSLSSSSSISSDVYFSRRIHYYYTPSLYRSIIGSSIVSYPLYYHNCLGSSCIYLI